MATPVAVSLAVLAGVLIVTQAALLGPFERHLNAFVIATWVHLAGFVFGVVGILIGRLGFGWPGVRAFPWGLLAGVAGVGIVASIASVVRPLGLGTTLAIVVGVQLLLGLVIDATGVLGRPVPVDLTRVAGGVLIVVGVLLVFQRNAA